MELDPIPEGMKKTRSYSLAKMNLSEIAKRAKVSTATASRAINRIPTVDPRLARRVRKVAQKLGYYPNTQARALVSGRSRMFGIIVPGIADPFCAEMVDAFERVAQHHDYDILLMSTVYDAERMASGISRMIERRVDAIAILAFAVERSVIEHFCNYVPLVLVDLDREISGITSIGIDYQHGIRQAVQHLAALRHVRIAFVSGPTHLKSAGGRRDAFEHSMSEIGLEVRSEFIIPGDYTVACGIAALTKLMALPEPPTAVLCSNDMIAIGVLGQAYDRRISVPTQLSVIGLDDIRLSQFTIPPLTTVQLSRLDLATLVFNALLGISMHLEKQELNSPPVLTTNLVLRQSTAIVLVS